MHAKASDEVQAVASATQVTTAAMIANPAASNREALRVATRRFKKAQRDYDWQRERLDTLAEGVVLFEQMQQGEYQAALSGWSTGLYVDPRAFWHSGDEYVFNITRYANPEVDRLIAAGERETDPEAANAIWHEVQAMIYQDQPYTFLYWVNNLMAIHERFEGVEANLLTPIYGLERWWENPNPGA